MILMETFEKLLRTSGLHSIIKCCPDPRKSDPSKLRWSILTEKSGTNFRQNEKLGRERDTDTRILHELHTLKCKKTLQFELQQEFQHLHDTQGSSYYWYIHILYVRILWWIKKFPDYRLHLKTIVYVRNLTSILRSAWPCYFEFTYLRFSTIQI